jgi:hypothetical protein
VINQIKDERQKIKDDEVLNLIDNLQIISIAKKEEELFKLIMSSSDLIRGSFGEKKQGDKLKRSNARLESSDNRKILGSEPENDNRKFEKIVLNKDTSELKLIQKIRDEAHRFAITFNRDTRIKSSKKNILESLP